MPASLGKVLLAALPPGAAERALAGPSRSEITARWRPGPDERAAELREVRARGWSLTDEQLAAGLRSVAAPLRDGDGRVIAALNWTVHAADTPLETLTGAYLPLLLQGGRCDQRGLGTLPVGTARHRPAEGRLDSQHGRQQTSGRRTGVRPADIQVNPDQQDQLTIRPEDCISRQEWSKRR